MNKNELKLIVAIFIGFVMGAILGEMNASNESYSFIESKKQKIEYQKHKKTLQEAVNKIKKFNDLGKLEIFLIKSERLNEAD